MSDFQIVNGRFVRAANGDFVVLTGREATKQRVRFRLMTMRGEWFLDTTLGPDYQRNFLAQEFQPAIASRDARAQIAQVPGVRSVKEVIVTKNSDQTISMVAKYVDEFGPQEVTV